MKTIRKIVVAVMVGILSVPLLTSCSTPAQLVKPAPTFFPPAPNEPRIQYLTGFSSSKIVEDTKNSFFFFLSGAQQGDQTFTLMKPFGIAVYKGIIYVSDTGSDTVYRIDLVNKKFEPLKGNTGYGRLKKPVRLTVDESGNLYVTDTTRKEIVVFTPEGDYLKAYGKGIASKGVAAAVDLENVYILDQKDLDIKVIDRKSGLLVKSIGESSDSFSGFIYPSDMTMDSEGFLYVTDIGSGVVAKFDKDGHTVLTFGQLGDALGEFARPKGIGVDAGGVIYVVDSGLQTVQLFNQDGRLLMFFGDRSLTPGSMNLPTSIWLSRDNLDYYKQFADPSFESEYLIFIINQYGSGAENVSIYGFGHKKEGIGAEPGTEAPPTNVNPAPGAPVSEPKPAPAAEKSATEPKPAPAATKSATEPVKGDASRESRTP